jgi:sulfur carrier protein
LNTGAARGTVHAPWGNVKMQIWLNGEKTVAEARESLAAAVRRLEAPAERVAAMRNGLVIPRERWADTILEEGDTVEVVIFAGGGQ